MTIKKLTKLGNSQAFVSDKQMLAQLGLSEGDEVQVTLHGYQLVMDARFLVILRLSIYRALTGEAYILLAQRVRAPVF